MADTIEVRRPALSRSLLPLIPAALQVVQVLPTPDRITILTAPKPSSGTYPLCGAVSSRVHSHYTRTLADLPWQGRAVTVQVRARRFRCATAGCLRQVFAERLPEVAQSWARRTARLGDIQRHVGLALGGEPGSRLAARLSMPASGDTLLRLVQATGPEPPPSPRVVGIDDWAWRRGQRYGTIICDLERERVIDLLPETHLVDAGYVDADLLVDAKAEHGIELVGPVRPYTSWQAKAGEGYDISAFRIDWDARAVTCPQGHKSVDWVPG